MSDETPVVPVEQPVVPVEPEAPVVPESPAEPEKDWKAEAEKERQRAENYKREIEVKGLREKKDRNLPALTSTDGKFSEEQLVVVHNDYISKREDVFHELRGEISGLTAEQWDKAEPLLGSKLDSVYSKATAQGRLTARGEIKDALMDVVNYAKTSATVPPAVTQADLEKARLQGMREQQQLEAAEISGVRPRTPQPAGGTEVTDADRQAAANSNGAWREQRASEIRLAKEARARQYAPRYSSLETE